MNDEREYQCEHNDKVPSSSYCPNVATVEVHSVDEDGGTYSGYYCEDHIPTLGVDEELIELKEAEYDR